MTTRKEFEALLQMSHTCSRGVTDADVMAAWDAQVAELERERMRLAVCGVVALADTPESAARARDMLPTYWSASCGDVARMVDSLMALREEVEMHRKERAAADKLAACITIGIGTNDVEALRIGNPLTLKVQRMRKP